MHIADAVRLVARLRVFQQLIQPCGICAYSIVEHGDTKQLLRLLYPDTDRACTPPLLNPVNQGILHQRLKTELHHQTFLCQSPVCLLQLIVKPVLEPELLNLQIALDLPQLIAERDNIASLT